jgi:hypothetical protein
MQFRPVRAGNINHGYYIELGYQLRVPAAFHSERVVACHWIRGHVGSRTGADALPMPVVRPVALQNVTDLSRLRDNKF